MILSSLQGLVSREGLPAPDSELDVLGLTEYGWRDRLTLIELHWELTREWVEAELRMAEVCRLAEQVHLPEEYCEGRRQSVCASTR